MYWYVQVGHKGCSGQEKFNKNKHTANKKGLGRGAHSLTSACNVHVTVRLTDHVPRAPTHTSRARAADQMPATLPCANVNVTQLKFKVADPPSHVEDRLCEDCSRLARFCGCSPGGKLSFASGLTTTRTPGASRIETNDAVAKTTSHATAQITLSLDNLVFPNPQRVPSTVCIIVGDGRVCQGLPRWRQHADQLSSWCDVHISLAGKLTWAACSL